MDGRGISTARAQLRKRIEQFGIATAALGGLALTFRIPKLAASGELGLSAAFHGLGVCAPLVAFAVVRAADLSVRGLRIVEAVCTFITVNAYGWMAFAMADQAHRHGASSGFVALLATSNVVVARAALVPSSARRSFLVTTSCLCGLVPVMVRAPIDAFGYPPMGPIGAAAGTLVWWALATALATVTSSITFGLRRDVETAREYGQYLLLDKIGEGGMGTVYRARHRMLRRETALKLLPPTLSTAAAIARFELEVRLTARLSHPHTVTVFDYGRTPGGVFYYAMELLEGFTLDEVVRSTGAMPAGRVIRILRQVAGALAEAHALGLVHRDVKPSNIMLCRRGGELDVAKVLDFGLVCDQLARAGDAERSSGVLGTPHYLSPEAVTDQARVGPASDLYSLGAVAYFLLTAAPPFDAPTLVELCSRHVHSIPAPPSDHAAVPSELDRMVLGLLAKHPEDRPATARVVADGLEQMTSPPWTTGDMEAWWKANGATARHDTRANIEPASGALLEVDVFRPSR